MNELDIWRTSLGIFVHFPCNKISTYRRGYASDFVEGKMYKSAPNLSRQMSNLFIHGSLVSKISKVEIEAELGLAYHAHRFLEVVPFLSGDTDLFVLNL